MKRCFDAALPPTLPLAIWLFAAAAAGEGDALAERLAWFAPVSGDTPADGRPVCVPLPRGIIAAASNRYADLRLLDDQGAEIPYVIYGETFRRGGQNRFAFRMAAFDPDSQTLTLELPAERTEPYDRLQLHISADNFRKNAVVRGSDDREDWRELGRDALFDF